MRALITGAGGAVGRFFSEWLQTNVGCEVIITGRHRDVARPNQIECDLEKASEITRMVHRVQPSHIFHFAASFSGSLDRDIAVNAMSARHLLDAIRTEQLETRLVLLGSAAEYGVVAEEENPVREDRLLRPVSHYGLSKALQTQLAGLYFHEFGSNVVVARMFNILIPGLHERLFPGRIEQEIIKIKCGKQEKISVGNLNAWRDYVDGTRAAEMIMSIATAGCKGQIYHVASGKPIQMRTLLNSMLVKSNLDSSVVDQRSYPSPRQGYDVPIIFADVSKTQALARTWE